MTINDELLIKISTSLNQLSRMKAFSIINSDEWVKKPNGEKIYFLYQMNFANDDIANMIGTTIGTVQKEISVRKK